MDSTDKARRILKRLAKISSPGRDSKQKCRNGKMYDVAIYQVRTHWSAIEQALLTEIMKQDKEWSRSAMVRKAIHERAMRTLGEERYYEILENPAKFIK